MPKQLTPKVVSIFNYFAILIMSPDNFYFSDDFKTKIPAENIPEIDLGRTDQMRGMNVTIVTTAKSDEEGRFLLAGLGMPFAKRDERPVMMG